MTNKKQLKKELGYIYDSKRAWELAAMSIKGRVAETLKDSPKLNMLLRLVVLANIGIWSGLLVNIFRGL